MTRVQTAASQKATTPDEVLAWLRAGNDRFAAGTSLQRDLLVQLAASAQGQFPLAAVVGCIDSRVPVELVLDTGIGDIFTTRTAGNVIGPDVLGSLEFAAALAGVKAIVVLGHSSCGAVEGASNGAEMGHLTGLLAKIRPAVEDASGGDPRPGSLDASLIGRAVERNVRNGVASILSDSDVLRELRDSGAIAVVGAVYDISTGRVNWLDLETT